MISVAGTVVLIIVFALVVWCAMIGVLLAFLHGGTRDDPVDRTRVRAHPEQPGAHGDAAERGGVHLRLCPDGGSSRHPQ